jgi:hypothetical protein
MTRPSHLRIVASGDDWATELRQLQEDNLRRFEAARVDGIMEDIRRKVEKREAHTRVILRKVGFLAANWFAASLVTCCVLYVLSEFAR